MINVRRNSEVGIDILFSHAIHLTRSFLM
jgi:hypothetical protein